MDDPDFPRRPLTEADAAAYVELANVLSDHEGAQDERVDEEVFHYQLRSPLGSPDLGDFQGVFDGDRMIAFGRVSRRTVAEPVHWMVGSGGVHPDYRGRGVGTRLIRWMLELAPRVHERYFPGHPLEFAIGTLGEDIAARELFEAEGFTPLRWFFDMLLPKQAPVPAGPVPAGLELTAYSPELDEQVRLAHNEAFRDHWRFTPASAEIWAGARGLSTFRPELSFLLRDPADGAIAGYLLAASNEAGFQATGVRDVHFNVIGTTRPYRRRGVAAALIAHAVAQSRAQGYETATLGVDADNPSGALGLYERLGFGCEREYVVYNRVLVAQ
jgi:mycothiol synthase